MRTGAPLTVDFGSLEQATTTNPVGGAQNLRIALLETVTCKSPIWIQPFTACTLCLALPMMISFVDSSDDLLLVARKEFFSCRPEYLVSVSSSVTKRLVYRSARSWASSLPRRADVPTVQIGSHRYPLRVRVECMLAKNATL